MLQQICRTCLATHGELVPIFTNNYYVHNLPDKLRHTIRIEVSKDDDLPQMMCKKCVFLVDSLYCFKDQCEMAEVKLKKTLSGNQLNNTRKSELVYERDEDYSDALSSSEDEYHIEYVSEEARLAVEDAKRARRNARRKRNLQNSVKVKSVEILPTESRNSNFKNVDSSASHKNKVTRGNEEINVTDSDISSSYCMSEDSKILSNKNNKSQEKPQRKLKPGLKRKLDLNNSYNQLTKVPKKVIFKDSEYDDENTQYIEITENLKLKKKETSTAITDRTLPSTKIDSTILQKKICSFDLTSPKASSNSVSSTKTSKSAIEKENIQVMELRMLNLIKHAVLRNPKICAICSDSFDTYIGMLKHKVQMHMNPEEKCFYCPICQEKFFSHKVLIKHLDDHKDIYSFMCVLCSDNCYTEEMLRSHLASHVDLKDLTCLECTLSFEKLGHLLSHLDGHINKQLVCTFCIDSFDSKDSLQSHINQRHEVSSENNKSVSKSTEKKRTARFPCSYCERNFASALAVREHISQKHQDFACLACDKKFSSQDELNEHTKQSHTKPEQAVQIPIVDRKKFLCRVCHEILISRAVYSQHLKDKHCSVNQTNEVLKELSDTTQNEQPSHDISNPPASDMT